ncbi:hypothetical protein KO504_13060 [Winogradskyella psychrotolerans]|uniref:hypothetical protein n=1 Tax=Winogradskyella psychrotolerans TaxID=1344585 RepID=UPI001C06FE9D|nr:hypothetical protein [Winogradskyella psychrotolerans]MBU2922275.1 hypothetical protein [Winogradskyella psychrotolerans]
MKRYLTLLVLILCSCNNINERSEHSEMERLELDDANTLTIEKPYFNELHIVEEKLQETYDLIYLSKKNAAFETSRKSSTILSSNIILDSLDHDDYPMVDDLYQIGSVEVINDSMTNINFGYTVKQHNAIKRDTLKALIKKQHITIEGQTTTAIKIDFKNYSD